MLHTIEPLFDIDATLAAPVVGEIVLGVLMLKPTVSVYDAVLEALGDERETRKWDEVQVRSLDQTWWHHFWYPRGLKEARKARWEGGVFAACDDPSEVTIHAADAVVDEEAGREKWKVCALPDDFHLATTYSQLLLEADKQPDLAQARLLHWPGPRRKPWLHWSVFARTEYDQLWWNMYEEMCTKWGCASKLECLPRDNYGTYSR